MEKLIKNNLGNFLVIFVITALVFAGIFYYLSSIDTKGAEIQQIKILPTNYSGSWNNQEAALVQDLGPEASFEEFNQENSAHPLDAEDLTRKIVDEGTATESEEIIVEKILEFSDFGLPEEFSGENKEIRNVQLRLSLAFQNNTDQDSLIIEYQYNSSQYFLAEYRLNDSSSNAANNGYWLYGLPIFDNWQNLRDLRIKFIYRGTEGEIYLDALWLEVGYQVSEEAIALPEEQPQLPPEEEIPPLPEEQFQQPEEQLQLPPEEEILPLPEIVKIPQKYFSFFLEGQPIKSKKYLDWHPRELAIQENLENSEINVRVESDIIFSGACQKKYYVILMYRQPQDYDKNPTLFIYNKAFPCQNGVYQYTLDDLPENLAVGIYYFLVAERDATGPWQPITAIQPVRIGVEYR